MGRQLILTTKPYICRVWSDDHRSDASIPYEAYVAL